MNTVLDFAALISHFGPKALSQLCYEVAIDNLGLDAMNRHSSGRDYPRSLICAGL